MDIKELDDGIYMIDIAPLGFESLISCYILDFEKKAVVETGPKSSINSVFEALDEIGIKNLDYVFITHIHLDHGGGAGTLVNRFGGKIVCHARGAKHVSNPEKLWKASIEFSQINELYGKPDAVAEDQIIRVDEDSRFSLGDVEINAIKTEGHAPHHLSFFINERSILFSGDSAGMCLNNTVIPTTPSPFNLVEWRKSVRKMIELEPEFIAYTHFGMYEADELLRKVLAMAENWEMIAKNSLNVKEFSQKVKENDPELRKFMELYSYCDVMLKWIDYGFEGMFEYIKGSEWENGG